MQPNHATRPTVLSGTHFPYIWRWRVKHGERHGQRCRVWARGSMNSVGVEFPDGFKTVTARYAVRKASAEPGTSTQRFQHQTRPARMVRLDGHGQSD